MKTYTKAEIFAIMDKIKQESDTSTQHEYYCSLADIYEEGFDILKEVLNEIEQTNGGT